MKVTTLDGTSYDLGKTEASPTIGIVDYSRRETDAFGVTTVVRRPFSRRMSVKLGVPTDRIDDNARLLTTLRAKSALWVADPRFAWLSVTGYYEDLSIDLPTGDLSYCTLTVAGLAEKETVADTGVDPSANGRASTLRFVQPVTVTDTVLVSSSVAESDAAGWSASATYPLGATVVRGHRIFESLAAGNIGADPLTEASKWLDTGPTNRWAMFDEALGSSTIASAPVEFVLRAATAVSALALLDTNAATVRVRAGSYDRTVVPDRAGKALFLDFAAAANVSVTVTITPASATPGPQRWDDGAQWMDAGVWRDSLAAGDGTVTIGTFLFGAMKGLGTTETSPTAGITDYSVKETDEFGEVTVVERAWAKNMAVKAQIASSAVDVVANRIAAVRAQPALWIGDTVRDSLIVYGFFRDLSIEIGDSVSKLSLSIEGLSKAAPIVPAGTGSVAWPDITDPNGTKPTDNADKTSENTSKDTNAVGGVPAASVTGRLDTLVTVTIPAVEAAGAAAGQRITEARAAADLALSTIESEVERVDTRIDNISASGGYDDTALKAEVKRVDEVSLGRDAALGTRIDSVSASITTTDTNLRALVQTKDAAAVDRDNAISQRIDTLIAEGGGGSDGVDTVARSEIRRVEQAAVLGQQALTSAQVELQASSRADPTMLNGNANFSNWTDDRGTIPNGWGQASANPGAYANRVSGVLGKWALETGWNGGPGNFFYAVSGRSFDDAGGGVDPGLLTGPGWYVMEADITLVSGSLEGAGIYCASYNGAGANIVVGFGHFPNQSANGAGVPGAGVSGLRYKFAVLLDFNDPATRCLRFHPMTAWNGFSSNPPGKAIRWHKAGVRAATPSEIAAQRADSSVNAAIARIKTTEDTLADLPNRYATAQRASNIEASVGQVGGRIGVVETVTSNGTFATASRAEQIASYAGGVNARVDVQAGTIAGLGQKTAAYVRVVADAGNGRAALSLWSDQYGGAWSLTGDGLIDGNLTVNGTITARKFNNGDMSRDAFVPWTGDISPGVGQTVTVPWSLTLPTIPPNGRFIYEYTFLLITNAGQSVSGGTSGGKPVTIHYVEDGGGLFLSATDGQGNVYSPRANGSDRIRATTDFAPAFTAFVRRGSRNETINDGDNIQRYVAASYTLNRIDLKVTWVAI